MIAVGPDRAGLRRQPQAAPVVLREGRQTLIQRKVSPNQPLLIMRDGCSPPAHPRCGSADAAPWPDASLPWPA